MWSQTPNEESKERNQEIDKDWFKSNQFPHTVIGRVRLRGIRALMSKLRIPFYVPGNSAVFTNEYCFKYGKKEISALHGAKDRRS